MSFREEVRPIECQSLNESISDPNPQVTYKEDSAESEHVEHEEIIELTAESQQVNNQAELRHSTRDRKPKQTFTYETLGQPLLQPHNTLNTVAAHALHHIPFITPHYPSQSFHPIHCIPYNYTPYH